MLEIKNIEKLKGIQILDLWTSEYTVIDVYSLEEKGWYMFKVKHNNGVIFTVRLRRTPTEIGLYPLISNNGMYDDFWDGNGTAIDIYTIKDFKKFQQILTDLI
jgi:hypothetical protein